MAQKIQFIVTVLHEPKLLIFDEPFSGFDPINANMIKEEIWNLKENGTSIIFSTHRMESVEELCEYIALIHRSEKILDGKLSDIKKAFKNNIFGVGVTTEAPELLLGELKERYQVLSSSFDSREKQLDFSVQLPNENSASLLGFLGSKSNVNSFVEAIPSANDIFIRTIQNKGYAHE
jgi:ABC-2 type transport system ATP-binding protein